MLISVIRVYNSQNLLFFMIINENVHTDTLKMTVNSHQRKIIVFKMLLVKVIAWMGFNYCILCIFYLFDGNNLCFY